MEIYDTSAIRAAWETGDEDGLSDKDAAILEHCRAVLRELITEDLTDFQIWDDVPASSWDWTHHRYFNVTSQRMRDTDHQWDYLYVPEATATHYFWDGAGALPQ